MVEIGDFMRLMENKLYINALDRILSALDLSPLQGSRIMVTGATGMLGGCLVDLLRHMGNVRVIALGRNEASAEERFGSSADDYTFYPHDVCLPLKEVQETVDYIIHAASPADPVSYAQDPTGTLLANIQGTKSLLDYGLSHGMKRFLFVSSGEIYGQPNENMDDFTEDYCGPLDLSSPRACYPEGKRSAEVLCQSCIRQYGVDAVIVRPCHLFGPTMTQKDSRAVSEFFRSAADGQNIVMKSAGLLERSHCYVVDAAGALLLVLLKGERGQAYNIADRQCQMTIQALAQQIAEAGGCQVVFRDPSEIERTGYSKVKRAVLNADRLKRLGWRAAHDVSTAIRDSIDILRCFKQDG